MQLRGKSCIAVGTKDAVDTYNYGDELNGFYALLRRITPFLPYVKVPTLPEAGTVQLSIASATAAAARISAGIHSQRHARQRHRGRFVR